MVKWFKMCWAISCCTEWKCLCKVNGQSRCCPSVFRCENIKTLTILIPFLLSELQNKTYSIHFVGGCFEYFVQHLCVTILNDIYLCVHHQTIQFLCKWCRKPCIRLDSFNLLFISMNMVRRQSLHRAGFIYLNECLNAVQMITLTWNRNSFTVLGFEMVANKNRAGNLVVGWMFDNLHKCSNYEFSLGNNNFCFFIHVLFIDIQKI